MPLPSLYVACCVGTGTTAFHHALVSPHSSNRSVMDGGGMKEHRFYRFWKEPAAAALDLCAGLPGQQCATGASLTFPRGGLIRRAQATPMAATGGDIALFVRQGHWERPRLVSAGSSVSDVVSPPLERLYQATAAQTLAEYAGRWKEERNAGEEAFTRIDCDPMTLGDKYGGFVAYSNFSARLLREDHEAAEEARALSSFSSPPSSSLPPPWRVVVVLRKPVDSVCRALAENYFLFDVPNCEGRVLTVHESLRRGHSSCEGVRVLRCAASLATTRAEGSGSNHDLMCPTAFLEGISRYDYSAHLNAIESELPPGVLVAVRADALWGPSSATLPSSTATSSAAKALLGMLRGRDAGGVGVRLEGHEEQYKECDASSRESSGRQRHSLRSRVEAGRVSDLDSAVSACRRVLRNNALLSVFNRRLIKQRGAAWDWEKPPPGLWYFMSEESSRSSPRSELPRVV